MSEHPKFEDTDIPDIDHPEEYMDPVWPIRGEEYPDWRSQVNSEVRYLWDTFNPIQKRALWRWAEHLASESDLRRGL